MKHYFCEGSCHGVAEHAGECQADVCEKKGKPLTECDCEDGNHGKKKEQS